MEITKKKEIKIVSDQMDTFKTFKYFNQKMPIAGHFLFVEFLKKSGYFEDRGKVGS
jgi:hypothetical protein